MARSPSTMFFALRTGRPMTVAACMVWVGAYSTTEWLCWTIVRSTEAAYVRAPRLFCYSLHLSGGTAATIGMAIGIRCVRRSPCGYYRVCIKPTIVMIHIKRGDHTYCRRSGGEIRSRWRPYDVDQQKRIMHAVPQLQYVIIGNDITYAPFCLPRHTTCAVGLPVVLLDLASFAAI